MNTNMTEFTWFSKKSFRPCALDESSFSIERVKRAKQYKNFHFNPSFHPYLLSNIILFYKHSINWQER